MPLSKLKKRERYEGKGGERGGKRCPCISTRTRRPRRGAKKTERKKGMAEELIKREDISMEICSGDEEIPRRWQLKNEKNREETERDR